MLIFLYILLYRIGNFCARVDEGICAEGIDRSRKKCRRSDDTLRFLCPPVRLWMSNFVNSLTLKQNKITHRWHSRPLGSLAESTDRLHFFLWICLPSTQFNFIAPVKNLPGCEVGSGPGRNAPTGSSNELES